MCFAPASADPLRSKSGFDVETKTRAYCMTCHGFGGHGFQGYFPVPQIAGQQADYVQIQLAALVEARRLRDLKFVKYAKVHASTPEERIAFGEYLSKLKPVSHPGGSASLAAAGDKIFHEGLPDKEVPACVICHGPGAKGNGMFPRLAGQMRPYLIKTLTNWDKERGLGAKGADDNSHIMRPIAKSLSREQIEAVTAYLSSLK